MVGPGVLRGSRVKEGKIETVDFYREIEESATVFETKKPLRQKRSRREEPRDSFEGHFHYGAVGCIFAERSISGRKRREQGSLSLYPPVG